MLNFFKLVILKIIYFSGHRFDISKGKRRYSVRPKEGRKESAVTIVGPKKSYDHSPHEVKFITFDYFNDIIILLKL